MLLDANCDNSRLPAITCYGDQLKNSQNIFDESYQMPFLGLCGDQNARFLETIKPGRFWPVIDTYSQNQKRPKSQNTSSNWRPPSALPQDLLFMYF